MARIKVAYLGGGSTRAAGTMASWVWHGQDFLGSEIVLIDLDQDRLDLVATLARRMASAAGVDLTVTTTTDQRAGLTDCDAVLSSFRPGGFDVRALDERIPLKHGVIGQETQGPGGFFMALRSINVLKGMLDDIAQVAPKAYLFNYTNPVNVVAQAVVDNTDQPIVSLCEGPIVFPADSVRGAGLDPAKLQVTMAGLNHNCWSTSHLYDGQDVLPLLDAAWQDRRDDPTLTGDDRRLLHLAVTMRSLPASYYKYYFFTDEILRQLQAAPLTRAETILASVPDYWHHYREQAETSDPVLDPDRSRGGIHELELAIDAIAAMFNDSGAKLPVNVLNKNGALPGFDQDTVVEVWAKTTRHGFDILPQAPLPPATRGITGQLAEYQRLAAKAAWDGDRADCVRALTANPLVRQVDLAEALFDEMAHAQAAYLPGRLAR